jgi:hypothetical protein
MFHELSKAVVTWLGLHGFDPIVVAAIAILGLLFLERSAISNLRTLQIHWRRLLVAQIVAGLIIVAVAILDVCGVLPKKPSWHQSDTSPKDSVNHLQFRGGDGMRPPSKMDSGAHRE